MRRDSDRIDPPKRSQPAPDNSSSAQAWPAHEEHVATPVQIEARKLLEQAGSPELAKHAVDSAAPRPAQGSPQDEFARRLGFGSYLSLFEDSALLVSESHKQWFATAVARDEWILWNDADLQVVGRFPAREAAERAIPSSSGSL
ncbi:MAG TPA: hypothetical protein VMP01_08480 [Pirellulaceae bacterium]|nr:hypothetical protein [Pirellulaceae bacterium]